MRDNTTSVEPLTRRQPTEGTGTRLRGGPDRQGMLSEQGGGAKEKGMEKEKASTRMEKMAGGRAVEGRMDGAGQGAASI